MAIVMGTHVPSVDDVECSEATCGDRAVHGSPVPLCPTHLRETFEFAQGVVSEHWLESLAVAASRMAGDEAPIPESPKRLPVVGEASWVYFVRIGDLIKIGFSTYPRARFKQLRPDEVLAVMPGTLLDEKRCHAAFKHLQAHGEYFHPADDLLAFIADIKAAA